MTPARMTVSIPDPPVKSIFVPFFLPVPRLLERVRKGFQESPIVEVKGYPLRIFCLRDPETIAQLYSNPQAGATKHPGLLPRVQRVMGNGGFILAGGGEWRDRRQQVQGAFRRSELREYIQRIPEDVDRTLDEWAPLVERAEMVDIYKLVRIMMTRINLQMFFSAQLSETEVHDLEQEVHFIEGNFVKPSPLFIPFPKNLRFRRYAGSLRARMLRLIQKRRNSNTQFHDLLSYLLNVRNLQTGHPWPDKEIVDEILSILFGASVMSVTLTWAFGLMGSHPEIQQKVRQEILDTLGSGPLAVEDLSKLRYTQLALKEVIRLYPAAWGYPRHTDRPLQFGGVDIPANSLVIPMVYLLHRDPRFWKDPEDFIPERFQDEEASIPPFAYLPFSAGPRTCLGAGLAPLVLQTVLAKVLSRYRIISCPRFKGDPVTDFGFGIQPRDQVLVRLHEVATLSIPTWR